MKKLRLAALELGAKEVLTREQLKRVMGGDDGSGSSTDPNCTCNCNSSDDCGKSAPVCANACNGPCNGYAGVCVSN